ncbi:MAG: helix-turn-helix transcriptional regulator [Terriglobales bacterium]
MAKIAVELEQAVARRAAMGAAGGRPVGRVLAREEGWSVADLICTSGPQDRPFEEQHSQVSIAIVLAGTFQYRAADGGRRGELMTPGSLLLGNAGQCFECGHEHGTGDRCLSFSYAPDYFEKITGDARAGRSGRTFRILRLPSMRALSRLAAQACAQLAGNSGRDDRALEVSWEELGIHLAASALRLANDAAQDVRDPVPSVVARVTRAARIIEESPESELTVRRLAREARLSPYHFLRSFQQLTGVTPHQYLLRVRLREAAMRLATERAKVLDIALDCGFGDVSNFNRAFRREFGMSPRRFRRPELQ